MAPGLLDLRCKEAKEQLLRRLEALYMGRLFERHGNNISRIARDAGVDRHLVRKLLRRHGINGWARARAQHRTDWSRSASLTPRRAARVVFHVQGAARAPSRRFAAAAR